MDELEDGELNDNYNVVNMDIDSDDANDEAENLRKILLKQMQKKRNPQPATPRPLTPKIIEPPSFRPPLSPPGFNSYNLPPPPIPPQISYSENDDDLYDPLCTGTENLEMEDTPRSPDDAIQDALQFINSSDSNDEPAYEFDLDSAKKDSRNRKREIDRLFKRQKANELEYKILKSSIEQAKKELNEMEKKLLHHAEKGMEINTRIQSHFDRYFVSDNERLEQINTERSSWKSKFVQRSARSKERIRNLKENAALVMSQPYSRPKVIPLSPISTPPSRFSVQVENSSTIEKSPIKTPIINKVSPLDVKKSHSSKDSKSTKSESKCRSSSKEGHRKSRRKESKRSKSTDKRLEKVADQLNIAQIVGEEKDSNEVEAELLTRILERAKKKQRSKENSRKQSKNHSAEEPKISIEKLDENDHVEDPIQDPIHPSFSDYPNLDTNFPTSSRFISLELAAQNPLIGVPAYRTSPSFPFEHIDHVSVSNKLKPEVALCPFELHGVCVDAECQWQHDRDFRLTDQEIIRDILNFWPTLCPPGVTSDTLAQKLLSDNSVDYVARMLSSAIPSQIRDQCFSEELKDMIAKSTEQPADK